MISFLNHYKNPNVERFNIGLINQDHDKDIVHHVMDSWKSIEVLPSIKILSAELEDDESEIDINDYIRTRNKSNKDEDVRYQFIAESRYAELRVRIEMTGKDGTEEIVKKMLIPTPDEKGYYTISGTRYFLLYQLVDASTYVRGQTLINKSLTAVSITRMKRDYLDIDKVSYTASVYQFVLFKKVLDVLIFFFAKMGVSETIRYFGLQGAINFTPEVDDKENFIYFMINTSLYIEVDRELFTKYDYVRSVVFMILGNVTNRTTIEDLASLDHWIEKLGSARGGKQYTFMEKGLNGLLYFDRMLDEATKEVLKVHKKNKKDIYTVVRWMIQNYGALRSKDDLDLSNKRLRRNEYVASLLTKEFSKRINRVISLGRDVDLKKLKDIFAFPGDILLTQLHRSGLLRFDDRINDMDMFSKLRFTLKGPNSLGGSNSRSMAVRYRGLHPSYLGVFDINVCGTSDPGSSGVLTPFAKTHGLFFDDKFEPEDGVFEIEQEVRRKFQENEYVINLVNNTGTIEEEFAMLDMFDSIADKMSFKKTKLK